MRKTLSILTVSLAVLAMTAYTIQCFCPTVSVEAVEMACHADEAPSCCCNTDVEPSSTSDGKSPFVVSIEFRQYDLSPSLLPHRFGALAPPSLAVLSTHTAVCAIPHVSPLYLSQQSFLI